MIEKENKIDENNKDKLVTNLTGKFLVASKKMEDGRFKNSVIYICSHSKDGAMGLVVNDKIEFISFEDIVEQLELKSFNRDLENIKIYKGGPIEKVRGFVLHSTDYKKTGTVAINDELALSASTEILQDIASGFGPKENIIALGYASWSANQLEQEIINNDWICVPYDKQILFNDLSNESKWRLALISNGIDPDKLSISAGNA